jgi:integrase
MTAISTDTVEGWLNHWLTHIAVRCVRPRTLESYESMIRMHITPYLGGQRLDRLQPEHLEHLYNALLEKDQSPTSVLRVHRTIFRALKVAMQRQRIHRNVATLVDPPAQHSSEVATALTLEEATAVLDTARGLRNEARWTVALALGLRQSEALALQWKDIDADAHHDGHLQPRDAGAGPRSGRPDGRRPTRRPGRRRSAQNHDDRPRIAQTRTGIESR